MNVDEEQISAPAAGAVSDRSPPHWEDVLNVAWRPILFQALACVAAVVTVWEILFWGWLYEFITSPENGAVQNAQDHVRLQLLLMLPVALVGALAFTLRILRRARKGLSVRSPPCLWIVIASTALPFLSIPGVQYQNLYLTGLMVIALSAAVAYTVRSYSLRAPQGLWRRWDLSRRTAWFLTLAAWLTFALVMGFLSHWRFITFHAEPYDCSWETNAVWGITHHGVPTISIGADSYYRHGHLPALYFNLHAPFAYYLYAPFYLLWPDSRTLLWLQALWIGSGSIGAYLVGRTWFRREWAGVALAWVYVLNPGFQGHCLHDIHANVLAAPCVVLAAGLMEARRIRAAVAVAFVAALCREETAVYSACLGLFWVFSGPDRRRVRAGLVVVAGSLAVLLLITMVLMPLSGGHPRWSHYDLNFRGGGIGGVVGSLVLNPWGTVVAAFGSNKADFFWLSLVPVGFLVLWGGRAGWFALASLALLVASGNQSFFTVGVNYSAPIGLVVTMMTYAGARAWLLSRRNRSALEFGANRVAIFVYLVATALLGNFLYGNIAGKSYQFEYGEPPYRRASQYDYRDRLASIATLPPFGQRERDLWEAIHRVPKDAAIATSWSINAQLSSRDVAVILPYLGETNDPANRPRFVVIDKLPAIMEAPERSWLRFRGDPAWRLYFENRAAAIFERK